MTDHEWRPWLGGYVVSNRGDVYSTKSDRTLKPRRQHPGGYVTYSVHIDGRQRVVYGHTLVLEAFIGPRPDGHQCCHIDGNPKNNHLPNLMWGTRSTNMTQAVEHGTHPQASKTHCPQGHPYDEANTRICTRRDGTTFRQCRECNREACRKRDAALRTLRDAHCESCYRAPDHCTHCGCHEPKGGEECAP